MHYANYCTTNCRVCHHIPTVQSTSQVLALDFVQISPYKNHYHHLLEKEPTTEMEKQLQSALHDAQEENAYNKGVITGLQSTSILNGTYCDLVHSQLAAQEHKKKSQKKGKLVGDGMLRLLSAEMFVQQVVEFDHAATEKAVALVQ